MIDRIFSAALTVCVLAAGTLAIGSALFEQAPGRTAKTPMRVIQLERVVVVGKRAVPGATVASSIDAQTAAQRVQ